MHQKSELRVRALFTHCLYRRVILWTATVLVLVFLSLFSHGLRPGSGRILDLVNFRNGGQDKAAASAQDSRKDGLGTEEKQNMPHWIKYRHLDGYFTGLKAIVPLSNYTPEFPRGGDEKPPPSIIITNNGLPTPTPFIPYPDYKSSEYTSKHHKVRPCYLDPDETIPAPDLYAYDGVVQGQPEPVIGSHSVLGLRDDICFDRFGRYGPYGLGYSYDQGGLQEGMDTERRGSEIVWSKTGKIDYGIIDWGDAQERCNEANKERFSAPDEDESLSTVPAPVSEKQRKDEEQARLQQNGKQKIDRIAVVIRSYVGFKWTRHAILNFRAMISELALRSGGEYTVHFLLHVRDNKIPIWADAETAQRVLDESVPAEFHSSCTLWSEAQMRLMYPGDFSPTVENPSRADVHGVYRSAHMPLQHFALSHPEYKHFWNWEMDMRWLGNYYELFDRLGAWARDQSRVGMWERNEKYYLPHLHGSWENFTEQVHVETREAGRRPVLGPVLFAGRSGVRAEEQGATFLPSGCGRGSDPEDMMRCGVGEDADLITLNPLFDAEESGWVFARDVTGYDDSYPPPPRRSAIITASRLSRRLLAVMHEETWRLRHSMFSEMFPGSMALHHGLKALYAPHPVFLDREWGLDTVDANFNGGRDRSTGGHGSPFDLANEHNHKGASWYYNSEFAGLLWRRWLGYAQADGRGSDGGRAGEGTPRGGREEEEGPGGTGRMCLRSMLVHPIKWENPGERRA